MFNHGLKKINCNFIEGRIVLFQYFIFKTPPKITIFMIDSHLFEILSKKNRISNVQDIKKIFSLFNQKNVN